MKDVIGKSFVDLGKQTIGGLDALAALGSGAAMWPVQKLAGLIGGIETDVSGRGRVSFTGFSAEEARKAEAALNKFVYQPYTREGHAATQQAMKALDIALKPSRMAGGELERRA